MGRSIVAIGIATGAAAAVLSTAVASWAQGRFPASNQVSFGPGDPNFVVVRTTYGVLPSTDNGATWRYLCDDVFGLSMYGIQDPAIGVMSNDAVVAGTPGFGNGGLSVSTDVGCNWSCIGDGLAGQSVIDVAVRPDDPTRAVALTGTFVSTDAAAGDTYTQVFETTDNGRTWSPLGVPLDSSIAPTTVGVAKSDPSRLYVAATRGSSASLFVSKDRGAHWAEEPIPAFDPTMEQAIFVAGIDPTNAERVYLRSSAPFGGGRLRLYVRNSAGGDGGSTFSTTDSLSEQGGFDVDAGAQFDPDGELLAFALSPDGSKVYAGTVDSGLWIANSSDMMFSQKNAQVRVRCLGTRGSELWACSDGQSGFVVGESLDEGATFTPKMKYVSSVSGPVACQAAPGGPLGCGATANATSCVAAYTNFCGNDDVTNSCGTGADSGAGAADADAAADGTTPGASSCGCLLAGRGEEGGFATAFGMLALAWVRRRALAER